MHATPERWTGALKKKKKKADHGAFSKLSVRAFGFEDSWARESIWLSIGYGKDNVKRNTVRTICV